MGPPHIVPYFPIVIGYPPAVIGSTYIPLEEIWGLMGLIRKRANNKFCELKFKNQ